MATVILSGTLTRNGNHDDNQYCLPLTPSGGVRPISKTSDYHFINNFSQLISAEEPVYFQVILKSAEYDDYLFDKHMEMYDVSPVNNFSWPGLLEYARALHIPALFLVKSDIGIDRSAKFVKKMNKLFFILYIPGSIANRCSYLKSTNRNYYADNLWDNNMPSSCQARRYKQMQLKLLPLLEEYEVETLQFIDIAHFEKYYKLLKLFNYKWTLQYARSSIPFHDFSSIASTSRNPLEPATIEAQNPGAIDSDLDPELNLVDSSEWSPEQVTSSGSVRTSNVGDTDDALTTCTDSVQEEHDRSSPTDLGKAHTDHEKEPLTPSGTEEERLDGSGCTADHQLMSKNLELDSKEQDVNSSNDSQLHSFA